MSAFALHTKPNETFYEFRRFHTASVKGKVSCKIVLVPTMKAYEGVDLQLHSFLTFVRIGTE
jgi:hypothetical protein